MRSGSKRVRPNHDDPPVPTSSNHSGLPRSSKTPSPMRTYFKRLGLMALAMGLLLLLAVPNANLAQTTDDKSQAPSKPTIEPVTPANAQVMEAGMLADDNPPPTASTADHSKFPILQQDFQSGPEVTAACLTCHTNAAKQLMKTSHWTWICPRARQELEDKQGREVGKGEHIINNFCIALGANEPRCTSCHAGYGWEDKNFDFTNETLVDCLVCHDTTKSYKKFPVSAGHPVYAKDFPKGREWPKGSGKIWPPADLKNIALNVGKPSRHNCGTCHFFGGGGEGVKHGDMDVSLAMPHEGVDVHMNAAGLDFKCTQCHTTMAHQVSGRCFTIPALEEKEFALMGHESNKLLACESCHGELPHENKKLNDHTDRVSCQTCHIPTMARERPTKMWWDWSKAGEKSPQGKPMVKKGDVKGATVSTYDTKKGEFIWVMNETPEYIWFNGKMKHTFIGDVIDDQTPASQVPGVMKGRFDNLDMSKPIVRINIPGGDATDPEARITPVKIHRGKQVYDKKRKILAVPKLFPSGEKKGEAYWKSYDWDRAIVAGMDYIGQEYSGEYDFIQTEMVWPLAHMVPTAKDAVSCAECHTDNGRLASIQGVYMPGRDRNPIIDYVGWGLVLLTLVGAMFHGLIRMVTGNKHASQSQSEKQEADQ